MSEAAKDGNKGLIKSIEEALGPAALTDLALLVYYELWDRGLVYWDVGENRLKLKEGADINDAHTAVYRRAKGNS